ncbi:MAG: Jag N-terminal domain-containing protein [Clostridia bacterium]|nr:Jag N-terminal domain-containing protein [Clostridia bacterium]
MKIEYTVTGKTVEEAYKKAVELYSSYGEIAMEEIISRGKKGFLGVFGSVPAEIRISVDDGKEEKKPQIKKEKKPQPQPQSQPQQSTAKAHLVERPQQQKKKTEKPQPKPQAEKPVQAQEATKPQPKAQPKPKQSEPIKDEDIKVTAAEKQIVIGFLKSFVSGLGLNCEVKGDLTEDSQGYVSRIVTVEGENASALIGHHGETLDSIQYLANLCLARKSEGDHKEYVKVIVDIENYRAKREQTLRTLARKMSEKAIRQQRSVHLEPMNPYERRIVHSEVQKIPGVTTHSIGYDENRKIVISLEKK